MSKFHFFRSFFLLITKITLALGCGFSGSLFVLQWTNGDIFTTHMNTYFRARIYQIARDIDTWRHEGLAYDVINSNLDNVFWRYGIEISIFDPGGEPFHRGSLFTKRIAHHWEVGSVFPRLEFYDGSPVFTSFHYGSGGYVLVGLVPGINLDFPMAQFFLWCGAVLLCTGCILALWVIGPLVQIIRVVKDLKDWQRGNFKTARQDAWGLLSRALAKLVDDSRQSILYRQQLMRDISHDLRSPLTRLRLGCEIVFDQISGLPVAQEGVNTMRRNIDHIIEQTGRILETFRLECSFGAEELKPCSLDLFIKHHIHDWAAHGAYSNVKVFMDLRPISFILSADRYLVQILENLVFNAIQHAIPESIVWVKTEQEASRVLLSVENYGNGIAKSHLPYLFEPFYRVSLSRQRDDGKGYGLGLALVSSAARFSEANVQFTRWDGSPNCVQVSFRAVMGEEPPAL